MVRFDVSSAVCPKRDAPTSRKPGQCLLRGPARDIVHFSGRDNRWLSAPSPIKFGHGHVDRHSEHHTRTSLARDDSYSERTSDDYSSLSATSMSCGPARSRNGSRKTCAVFGMRNDVSDPRSCRGAFPRRIVLRRELRSLKESLFLPGEMRLWVRFVCPVVFPAKKCRFRPPETGRADSASVFSSDGYRKSPAQFKAR